MSKSTAILLMAVLLLPGCEFFAFGYPIPSARVRVILDEPIPEAELFARLNHIAREHGFPYRRGTTPLNHPDHPDDLKLWGWYRDGELPLHQHHSLTMVIMRNASPPDTFVVHFQQDGNHPFDETEWLMFYRWVEVTLPKTFPGATIDVTVHPAKWTDPDEVERISRETGIKVPSHLLKS